MMVRLHDLVNQYPQVVRAVIRNGHRVSPRGTPTREILGAQLVITDPRNTLPLGTGRNLSKAVAAVEALQLIGGFTDPELTCRASGEFEKVKDGGAFHGAYGPRAAAQFPRVVSRLRSDAHSRRVVVNIWDPLHDLFREGLHDYPCTIALEYMIRDDKLIAITHMRSNDVWLGLAYDAFVFTQVQLTLANVLCIEAGTYIHHASSLHIYESDIEKAEGLHDPTFYPELPTGLDAGTSWATAQAYAQRIVYGDRKALYLFDPSAAWYKDALP